MTENITTSRKLVPVNQIDREAYARIAIVGDEAHWEIISGDWDAWEGVQAFARHRLLVEQLTADKCAELAHGTTSLDDDFPYVRGRQHAYLAVREMFPAKEHDQFCVCELCIAGRQKYLSECD